MKKSALFLNEREKKWLRSMGLADKPPVVLKLSDQTIQDIQQALRKTYGFVDKKKYDSMTPKQQQEADEKNFVLNQHLSRMIEEKISDISWKTEFDKRHDALVNYRKSLQTSFVQ